MKNFKRIVGIFILVTSCLYVLIIPFSCITDLIEDDNVTTFLIIGAIYSGLLSIAGAMLLKEDRGKIIRKLE